MDFADKLAAICAKEITEGRGDPDRISAMLERLSHSLGMVVAEVGRGQPRDIDDVMEAVEAFIHAGAVDHAPLARMMAELRGGK